MRNLFLSALVLSGFIISCNDSQNRIGVKCDNPRAVELAEELLNQQGGGAKISIDRENIIEWDYKDGRYLCRAKAVGYIKNATLEDLVVLSKYGLKVKDNRTLEGWVYYQTFVPTIEREKLKRGEGGRFWVELLTTDKAHLW